MNTNQMTIYETDDGRIRIDVLFDKENVWQTQKLMAMLFECSVDNISLHLKNIFSEGELDERSVVEEYSATAADGKRYKTQFYNLDMIISVGYRIKSSIATQFRIWATKILREYIIKGFTLDDDRLKVGGGAFAPGQVYVALIRCRSLKDIRLARPHPAERNQMRPAY